MASRFICSKSFVQHPRSHLLFVIWDVRAVLWLQNSLNPKEYNGYKVYWDDGAQVLAPHDTGIIEEVERISSAAEIKFEGNPDLIRMARI